MVMVLFIIILPKVEIGFILHIIFLKKISFTILILIKITINLILTEVLNFNIKKLPKYRLHFHFLRIQQSFLVLRYTLFLLNKHKYIRCYFQILLLYNNFMTKISITLSYLI